MVFGTMREKTFSFEKGFYSKMFSSKQRIFPQTLVIGVFLLAKKSSFRVLRRLFWLFILVLWD